MSVSTPAETPSLDSTFDKSVQSDLNNDDNASVVSNSDSVVSGKNDGGKASGIPKPSGIRPPAPSRIGRLCTGQQQKPAVPTTPPPPPSKNGSDVDTLRRLPDDLGRHRLTDVQEETEDDFSSYPVNTTRRNRYSSIGSTASSMDYLWDLHPRRLSEAGLSRHSDNSTVLTEDTDSFIIGQRVWVGGTKPGSIAYIGDTQFAPGEWAGIVLDQPIGKNDGSVGGIRYFQCEPKKGVFSRLTRLTRYPLTDPEFGSGDAYACSTPLNNGTRRSPISPTGSTSFIRSPQSLNTSNTSLASTHVDFKLGDRVIIKSSQGSKIGTLRYIGITDFASGEWCGVELDDPRGKNDGSVEGKRYFECRPNFGLFAPVAKVSRSPSSRKPGSCIVHSGPGIPPSGFKKTGSKESLTSNASITSAASGVRRKVSPKTSATPLPTRTALQEVLKEKQQHIERLLKERDLERGEIAKAASQVDEIEQKYTTLRQEYDQYRAECEKSLREHRELLSKLKEDREELVASLEDERRKNEDLQFRFEEAAITKADLERKIQTQSVANDVNLGRIKNLEDQLASERGKAEHLEADSNKLFEAEETLLRLKEENEILRYEVEVATTKILAVESENLAGKDVTTSLQAQLNELQGLVRKKDEAIEQLKIDGQKLAEDARITLGKEVDAHRIKTEALEAQILGQTGQMDRLRSELAEAKGVVDEKVKTLDKLALASAEAQEKLSKDVSKLKMELSAKNLDLENSVEALRRRQEEIKALKSQLESLSDSLSAQDIHKENLKLIEGTLKKELEDARATIKTKIIEVEESKKDFAVTLDQKEAELREANKTIQQYAAELEKLNSSVAELKESSTKTSLDMEEVFTRKLQAFEGELIDATTQLKTKTEELEKASDLTRKLEDDIARRTEEVTKAQAELEAAKKRAETEAAKLNEELTRLKLESGDLQRKLAISNSKIAELTEDKSKLEGSSGDYTSKLEELVQTLGGKEKMIESIRHELTRTEHDKQELELKHQATLEKANCERTDLEDQIKKLVAENDGLKRQRDELKTQGDATAEDLNKKIKHLQDLHGEKDTAAKRLREEGEKREADLKTVLTKTTDDLQAGLSDLQSKLEDLTKENVELKEGLTKKAVELIEMDSKHNRFVEEAKQSEAELKTSHEEQLRKVEFEKRESENRLGHSIELLKKQLADQVESSTSDSQGLEVKYTQLLQLERAQLEEQLKNRVILEERVRESTEAIQARESQLLEKDVLIKKGQDEAKRNEEELRGNLLGYEKKMGQLVQDNEALRQQLAGLQAELAGNDGRLQKVLGNVESSRVEKEEQIRQLKTELQINHQFAEKLRGENKALQGRLEDASKSREEQSEQCRDLSERVSKLTEEAGRSSRELHALQSDCNLHAALLGLLQLTQKQKEALVEQAAAIADENLPKLVDGIKVVSYRDEEQERRLNEARNEVEVLRKALQDSDSAIRLREAENVALQNELRKVSEASKVKNAPSKIPAKVDNTVSKTLNNNNVLSNEQLLEEKLFAESQVAFLNSIIVDIQKKNEEQKMRIELLESGYSPAAADELKLIDLTERKLPPRMYCDICEEFDLHETEDCPQQATDDAPAVPRDKGPKEKPPERPYCEICEIFGHNTEDCNDDQTY